MIIGLTADSTSLQDLRTIADWTIRPRLLSTGGVAQVAVIGGDIKEYQILLNPSRMKYYNISMDEVLPVIENMNQNATGGILYEYGNEYIVQGVMATTEVGELSKAVIKTVNDFPITLAEIAEVQIGAKSPKLGLASEKGQPAVLVTVTKTCKRLCPLMFIFQPIFSVNPALLKVQLTISKKPFLKGPFLSSWYCFSF